MPRTSVSDPVRRSPTRAALAAATFAVAAAALGAAPAAAQQPAYPVKPVRLVAPFPPGGGVDIVARLLGQELTPRLGQPIVIDNRSGASGNIGADGVAKSAPDGYTLLLTTNIISINAASFQTMPFDLRKDLAPVSLVGEVPLAIAAHPASGIGDYAALVREARAKPGRLAYSSCGNGSVHHLAGELFKSMAGVDLVHVPYKGCAPAMADVVAGQVPVAVNTLANILPHSQTQKLRLVAVTTRARSPLAPDAPTLDELGVRGFEANQWFGLFAPTGTPRPLVDRWNREIADALRRPAFLEKLAAQGITPLASTPEAFGAVVRDDLERWGRVARAIQLKQD
jgi:tripartite-type tricarboxylate transporter receptor subunit TctC